MSALLSTTTRKTAHSPGGHVKHCVVLATGLLCLAAVCSSQAAECSTKLDADDAMRFTPTHIDVPKSCANFTVTLTHTGRLPKLAMGHNWVLVKPSDLEGVARTAMAAGAQQNYVDSADTRVIAATPVIGAGESTSTTFAVNTLKAGVSYAFFCSFAGHSPVMQGTLSLVP
jgi:azurin